MLIFTAALLLAGMLQDGLEDNVVHVDERGRIMTQDRPGPGQAYSAAKYRIDAQMCRRVSERHSKHWEQVVENGVVKRTRVEIVEWEFVFNDPTDHTVTFVLDQPVPEGWAVDSDPRPSEVVDQVASFRVVVRPGQTVRLHVGERR